MYMSLVIYKYCETLCDPIRQMFFLSTGGS